MRNVNSDRYIRFHYDNDYFTKTDYYYSQGITLEYVAPALRRKPLNVLLLRLPEATDKKYGLAFNIYGYTPTRTNSDAILYGDRPYASAMSLSSFLAGTDRVHRQRLSATLHLGVIGPLALGKPIHTEIHRALDNRLPKGWQNQVQNDVLLNYQLLYEKQVAAGGIFLLSGSSGLTAGTVSNKLNAGFNFMFGHFDNPYQPALRSPRWQYYLYGKPVVNLVGYDAMMQGGIFNRQNPYTIPAGDITRLTFQADAGVVVGYKRFRLSYSQAFLTKEFRTGHYHRWGGISITAGF